MSSSSAVAAGTALGASARWAIGATLTTGTFPWATLAVNLLGCAAVGWCAIRLRRGTVLWYFVVTGCLGGFTTASAFGVETRTLLDDGRVLTALVYVVVSIVGGTAAVAASRRRALRVIS